MQDHLWAGAVDVLRGNDLSVWTRPAPRLYPHQWSWDSAFIAIGLAHLDPDRALQELESLFTAQWADGRVPQIVYNPAAPPQGYFPDAQRWACAELTSAAPSQPATSGIVQPPVHALAAWHIVAVAGERAAPLRPRLQALYPKLLAWQGYLAERRDPERSGLITIYHPWESGTDNSPRWDAPLAGVEVGPDLPSYVRRDLQHVADPAMRPSNAEYDRYLWLVECLKSARYDDAQVQRSHPFLVKDVLFSAIFAAAGEALGSLARWLGRAPETPPFLEDWTERSARAVQRCRPAGGALALDFDLRAGRPIEVATWAGLSPLLLPGQSPAQAASLVDEPANRAFWSLPGASFPVVPSAAPASPGYRQRTYWRGPSWPVANWLLWWGLRQQGLRPAAERLRRANLALLSQPTADFDEYFDPLTGEPLGSPRQSWTAAVTLDWLAVTD